MSTDIIRAAPSSSPRHQSLIVTLFGLYAREHSNVLTVASLVRMLGDLGVDPGGVRSSIHRLKKRDFLHSTRLRGQAAYELSSEVEDLLRMGDERIFHFRRASPDDNWLLISFSVPESERHLRHRIRSILTRLGCGFVSSGLWLAPEQILDEVVSELERAELSTFAELFSGRYVSGSSMQSRIGEIWNIDLLEQRHREFVDLYEPVRQRSSKNTLDRLSPEQAFSDYVPMVNEWRKLAYLDPGLPIEPAGHDSARLAAAELFTELHEKLRGPAGAHADALSGPTGTASS